MKEIFKCPKCGIVTWGGLKYCISCGEALTIICTECGCSWRYVHKYKFCPSCGTSVKAEK
ncbi:MAG: zinc ribbon domain-containing protein [Candidatus Omnitrophota bacterium]